ncbi:MAG: hypothetical protein NXH73_03855 [Flavobacteriaceae bacterium]|nr:hypothetical protein [Flavobacteriaceae bacterium]
MKTIIILLLFPIFIFGQNNNGVLNKIKLIESQIQFADSISSYNQEEIKNLEIILAHSRIDGKPTKPINIQIRVLRNSDQILRIGYKQSDSEEYFNYYYSDFKLIYAESYSILEKGEKIIKKKFYYDKEKLIYPSIENYDLEEIDIFIKAKELFKSNI